MMLLEADRICYIQGELRVSSSHLNNWPCKRRKDRRLCILARDGRECQAMCCDMSCTEILYKLGPQNGGDKVLSSKVMKMFQQRLEKFEICKTSTPFLHPQAERYCYCWAQIWDGTNCHSCSRYKHRQRWRSACNVHSHSNIDVNMLQASYQASGSADFGLALASLCVFLLKVSRIATIDSLLAVMLVGSTWQQSWVHRTMFVQDRMYSNSVRTSHGVHVTASQLLAAMSIADAFLWRVSQTARLRSSFSRCCTWSYMRCL